MKIADKIIDLGPGAGKHGGELLAEGSLPTIKRNKNSLTGQFLNQPIPHPLRGKYRSLPKPISTRTRKGHQDWLIIEKPSLRNLKGENVFIPKGKLCVVCGVSGSGKSTLIRDLLKPNLQAAIKQRKSSWEVKDAPFKRLRGADDFAKVIEVDQSPIGKTPRSIPATYIGVWDKIRSFYARLADAKIHGYNASTFSFNTKGGRCETCKGAGRVKLEMSFMPDAYIECEDCQGMRFSSEILALRWNGKNINDILEMSFEEAAEFFSFDSHLQAVLKLMVDTGLGYLTLGQSSPTLSGGEAQRLKLVSELAKGVRYENSTRSLKPNFYILEEPTIGLHLSDCQRLIHVLHRLVDQGHTVVVIEHHLDIITEADYLIEIGPGGGEHGGQVLYQGSVSQIRQSKKSVTKNYILDALNCK